MCMAGSCDKYTNRVGRALFSVAEVDGFVRIAIASAKAGSPNTPSELANEIFAEHKNRLSISQVEKFTTGTLRSRIISINKRAWNPTWKYSSNKRQKTTLNIPVVPKPPVLQIRTPIDTLFGYDCGDASPDTTSPDNKSDMDVARVTDTPPYMTIQLTLMWHTLLILILIMV